MLELDKIHCGDNCDLLGQLPRECIDLGDKKMTDDELDEFMERIFKPNEPPKETGNGTAV